MFSFLGSKNNNKDKVQQVEASNLIALQDRFKLETVRACVRVAIRERMATLNFLQVLLRAIASSKEIELKEMLQYFNLESPISRNEETISPSSSSPSSPSQINFENASVISPGSIEERIPLKFNQKDRCSNNKKLESSFDRIEQLLDNMKRQHNDLNQLISYNDRLIAQGLPFSQNDVFGSITGPAIEESVASTTGGTGMTIDPCPAIGIHKPYKNKGAVAAKSSILALDLLKAIQNSQRYLVNHMTMCGKDFTNSMKQESRGLLTDEVLWQIQESIGL